MSAARRPRRRSGRRLPGWAWPALAVALVLVVAAPALVAALVRLALLALVVGAVVLALRPSWRARLAGRALGEARADADQARAQLAELRAVAAAARRDQLAQLAGMRAQRDQARGERDQAVTAQRAARDQAQAATRDRDGLAARLDAAEHQAAESARQLAEVRAQLAEARESAQLAWDAAAEAEPAPCCPACACRLLHAGGPHCPRCGWAEGGEPDAVRRAALLADPLSGARPLGSG